MKERLILLAAVLPFVGMVPGCVYLSAKTDAEGANIGGGLVVILGFFAGLFVGVVLIVWKWPSDRR